MATQRNERGRATPAGSRRRNGVPLMLAIVLIIMALLMGGLAGYAVARKTDPHIHELQEAKDRVTELENTLTLIGYPVDDEDVDPDQWLYDNNLEENALAELTGTPGTTTRTRTYGATSRCWTARCPRMVRAWWWRNSTADS